MLLSISVQSTVYPGGSAGCAPPICFHLPEFIKIHIKDMNFEGHSAAHFAVVLHHADLQPEVHSFQPGDCPGIPKPLQQTCSKLLSPSFLGNSLHSRIFSLSAVWQQAFKSHFPGLSRNCKDQIPGFSRLNKVVFKDFPGHIPFTNMGCMMSKMCA